MNGIFAYRKLNLAEINDTVIVPDFSSANAQAVADNTDLNSITSIGNYKITGATSAATLTNCPIAKAGRLFVLESQQSQRLMQLIVENEECETYIRYYNGTTWLAWRKYLNSTNIKSNVGSSTTDTMSQNAITNLLAKTLNLYSDDITAVDDNTDLNSLTNTGNYRLLPNRTYTHSPISTENGRLFVLDNVGVKYQFVLTNTGYVYYRIYSNSIWTSWSPIKTVIPPPPMVTFIDDDGATTFTSEMLPLIQQYNVPISCPITTQRVGTTSGNTTFLDWGQIQSAFLAGAEILNHTYNHHPQVADMTQENQYTQAELELQYMKAKYALINHSISGGDILVLNNVSAEQERVQKAASHTVRCAFRSYGSTPVYTTSNPFYLPRYPLEPNGSGSQAITEANLKSILDVHAARATGWLVFCFHTDDSAWTSAHTDVIEYAINYCNTLGLQIVTADYGCRKYVEWER